LKGADSRDSAVARRDTAIDKYYSAMQDMTLRYKLFFPDSLRLHNLINERSKGYNPMDYFAQTHAGMILLTVVNAGDKALTNVKVTYPRRAYYEFEDNAGKLHTGESVSKFVIGELDSHEKLDILLWVPTSENYGRSEVSITYPDGIVQATQPTEVTGKTAWFINYWDSIVFFGIFGCISGLLILGLITSIRKSINSKTSTTEVVEEAESD
jgi:hypothetical protein